jgi:hypothetical protein
MWGPRLKYHLEVRARSPDDVVVSALNSFCGWSSGGFSEVLLAWSASLVATLPLWGVSWRGYAVSCTGLWTVLTDMGTWPSDMHCLIPSYYTG